MNKKSIDYILYFLSYIAIAISYPTAIEPTLAGRIYARFSISAYESLFGVCIIILIIIFHRRSNLNLYNKNYWPYWTFGLVVSIFYVLTLSVSRVSSEHITYVPSLIGKVNLLITFLAVCGYTFIFTNFSILLGQVIDKLKVRKFQVRFWYVFVVLMLIWGIQIFPLFPGMVSWDGYRQFLEFFHTHINDLNFTYYPTNHHPWASTLIFGSIFSIGQKIGGPNVGLFLIVLIQMIVSSIIYTKVVQFIGQNWGKKAAFVTFLFYASPFVAFWQVTIEKTPLFLAFTIWFVMNYSKILMDNLKSDSPFSLYVQLTVSGIFMSLFRNDGSYVVILSLLTLLIIEISRKKIIPRQLITCLLVFLAVYLGWNKVALPAMNVVSGSTSEVISLPMRQVSAVVLTNPESFSKQELATINKITPIKEIPMHFDINNADNLKSLYPVDSFLRSAYEIEQLKAGKIKKIATPAIKKETKQYLLIWVKQFFKHPKTYVITFFAANSSFLNPIIDKYPDSRGIMYGNEYMKTNTFLQPSWYNQVHYWFSDTTRKYIKWPNTIFALPLFRTVFQPAFSLWAVLFAFAYCLYKKSYLALVFIPIGLLAAVPLLSPVNGMERYMLPAIYTLPLLLVVIVNVRKGSKKNERQI
ncbi:hypothetical protein GCM10025879_18070 [Leuconostoc litchii]|nr:DUF6020 family protein [Leuconostoc litchii]GMA70561.1 hypothetical protein GCM10025879_18070 [Leuconostoc litchii]